MKHGRLFARRGRGALAFVGPSPPAPPVAADAETTEYCARACMPSCVRAAEGIRGMTDPLDLGELDRLFGAAFASMAGLYWEGEAGWAVGFGVVVQSGLLEACVDAGLRAVHQAHGFRLARGVRAGPNMERVLAQMLGRDTWERYLSYCALGGDGIQCLPASRTLYHHR